MITVIGIPVYFHYCGGELEEINYVMKSSSCCDGEEDDQAENNDCCSDENLVLKSNIDFTLKDFSSYAFVKTYCDLFFNTLPFSISIESPILNPVASNGDISPPKLQHKKVISTSVLRI